MPRGPAGEVPPNSRRPHDAGGAADPSPAGFEFALPGPAGMGFHYHCHVPDGGKATVQFSGIAAGGPEPRLVVLVARADAPVDRIEAVRALLKKHGAATAESLDPATAGGCDAEAGHRPPWSNLRAAPPVRAVRATIALAEVEALKAGIAAVPGLGAPRFFQLGAAGPDGRIAVDVAMFEGR